MSLERTQQTMNHYFEVMGRGGDFAEFYTADVTWTTTDTGRTCAARLRFATSLSPCTTTCQTPKRGGSSSRIDTHILKATVWRRHRN